MSETAKERTSFIHIISLHIILTDSFRYNLTQQLVWLVPGQT
jgi:hypothetical protein